MTSDDAKDDSGVTRHIHFVEDMTELDEGWRCQRCEWEGRSPSEVYSHRFGILSDCRIRRFIGVVSGE